MCVVLGLGFKRRKFGLNSGESFRFSPKHQHARTKIQTSGFPKSGTAIDTLAPIPP